jgi:phosphohistidine phosphatase
MKTVILVRHGKSSWKDSSLRDRDRPLNKRGKRDAPLMGGRVAARGLRPDRMITSPAKRARRTARAFAEALNLEAFDIDDRIYEGTEIDLLALIREQDDAQSTVMIVGHNPVLTNVVNQLVPEPILNVPTCGVVMVDFDVVSWSEVGHGVAAHVHFDYPKKDWHQAMAGARSSANETSANE